MMKKFAYFLLLLVSTTGYSQLFPSVDYPKNYFRNPMGIPIGLSGNFGELRTNHYHMGLDIRTKQRENLPVYAAAEGYISRIKIERYGYGRAIYINHPNGYTTLYAHLNNFYDALHQHVVSKQYADEQWEQDVYFQPGEFPVTKGQLIAYSGNTGGSGGPHLHFEIRDTKTENNLNPWLFNFNLADRIPPNILRFYYYDRRYSTYQAGPKQVGIKKAGTSYTTSGGVVVLNTPAVSFGISANDQTNTSPFRFGVYQAELYVDDTARFAFRMNNISYNESRMMNGAIDFKTKNAGGPYIQHLSRLPGNTAEHVFSDKTVGDGVYIINDTKVHDALVRLYDVAGNVSVLRFKFRYNPSAAKDVAFPANAIPLMPNQENNILQDEMQVHFPPSSFYHLVPFVYAAKQAKEIAAASKIHSLHNYQVPVQDSFTVKMKPLPHIGEEWKSRLIMQLTSNKKVVAAKGEWEGEWLKAKFWDLGNVRLIVDTVPPTIVPAGWVNGANLRSARSIAFAVRDDAGEIKSFRAELNGKWLMFKRKSYSFIHDFDERTSAGNHTLKVMVTDEAGNTTEKTYTFTR